MVLRAIISVCGILLLGACTNGEIDTVQEVGEPEKVDGKSLFSKQCVSCHGPNGTLGNAGAKDLTKSKLTESEVLNIITKGKGTMPPFEYLLNSIQERRAVTEYVISLRKESDK